MDQLDSQYVMHTWDKIAKSFDKTRKKPWIQCLDFISKLSYESVVGDLGCGNGRHTIEIAKQCRQVIGIDISNQLLQMTKQKTQVFNNVELIQGNLINIPLKNETLDAVLYIASLHNIPSKSNRVASLNEVYRVLKSQGTALITVWSRNHHKFDDYHSNITDLVLDSKDLDKGDVIIYWDQDKLHVPRFYHLYEQQELLDELVHAGFIVESCKEIHISSKNKPANFFITVTKKR